MYVYMKKQKHLFKFKTILNKSIIKIAFENDKITKNQDISLKRTQDTLFFLFSCEIISMFVTGIYFVYVYYIGVLMNNAFNVKHNKKLDFGD